MNVQLFWHVAVMGNWREVIEEQTAIFRRVGLVPKIGRLGRWVNGNIARNGEVVYASRNVLEYETPTLQELWKWAKAHPDGAVVYCHTKGVSKPHRENAQAWRKLMNRWVVERWQSNLPMLSDHDVVGVNHRKSNGRGFAEHFAGNFWMARNDWIAKLASPKKHAEGCAPGMVRFAPETWILSKPGYRYVSLCCENIQMARYGNAIKLLKENE